MTWRISNNDLNAMLDALATNHANGAILIYEGSQPANAHAAPTGKYLGKVTVGGGAWEAGQPTNGLNFKAAAGRALKKADNETWQIKGEADGTAGWFRFVGNAADDGAADSTESTPRIDGRIAVSGAEMNLSNTQIVTGATTTIDSFELRWPANVL